MKYKLYCPKCEFEIIEEKQTEGEEVFCQNCLAWSIIEKNFFGKFYLKFLRYETTTSKENN